MSLSFSVCAHVLASFGIIYFLGSFCGSLCFSPSRFLFVHFVIRFSDVLMSGIWNEVVVLEDPSLRSLVPDLLDLKMGVFEDRPLGYSCEAFAYYIFYYGAY